MHLFLLQREQRESVPRFSLYPKFYPGCMFYGPRYTIMADTMLQTVYETRSTVLCDGIRGALLHTYDYFPHPSLSFSYFSSACPTFNTVTCTSPGQGQCSGTTGACVCYTGCIFRPHSSLV